MISRVCESTLESYVLGIPLLERRSPLKYPYCGTAYLLPRPSQCAQRPGSPPASFPSGLGLLSAPFAPRRPAIRGIHASIVDGKCGLNGQHHNYAARLQLGRASGSVQFRSPKTWVYFSGWVLAHAAMASSMKSTGRTSAKPEFSSKAILAFFVCSLTATSTYFT